jgi:hypothetical protein
MALTAAISDTLPRETWWRGALPDLGRSPLIQEEKHFILAKAAQGIQQQLELFMVTGIWACKHSSGLSSSVTNAPQDSDKSASGNDFTV